MTDQKKRPAEHGELPPRHHMAKELRADIHNGKYKPGEKLPSQRDLAAQYGVVRNTAAEALDILKNEGLIVMKDRTRAFVREQRPLLRLGAERYSRQLRQETGLSPYRAEATNQGKTARVDCTSITRVRPPEDVAVRLNVSSEEESVIRRENWYYADDEPVQIGVTFIPWDIAKDSVLATSAKMGKGSLYARFEDLGYELTAIREEITSRMPTPQESEGLAIPGGVPVLEVLHTGIDQNDQSFEVTRFVLRADANVLDYRISIDS